MFASTTNSQQSNNIYNQNIMPSVFNMEARLANRAFEGAKNPVNSNIIADRGFNQQILNNTATGYPPTQNGRSTENMTDFYISPLSGQPIARESFTHNNMTPYFGSNAPQSTDPMVNSTRLGVLTGQDPLYRPQKTETKSFFDNSPNMTNPYGTPSFTMNPDIMSRYVASQKRQDEKPIQDIRVGPGLASGYTATPSGGLNQSNARDYVLPKTVDELRVLSRPKLTYEGRVIAGLKSGQRGLQAAVSKNRPEKWYRSTPERGVLSSSVKAAQLREKFLMKRTNKQNQKSYFGILGQSEVLKPRKEGAYKRSTKNNYMNPTPRNAHRADGWRGDDSMAAANSQGVGDYGKASWENRPNERDATSQRRVINNLTMSVKKIISPLTDLLRRTRKEDAIGNIRPEGNMNSLVRKAIAYDPNDIARTTIKETTIDNEHIGFVKSVDNKGIAYNPDDIARTTIKEQNIHNNAPYINLNPQAPRSARVYDPEDIARTTVKELTIDNDHTGFFGGNDTIHPGGYISTSVDMKNTHKQFLADYYYTGIADGEVGTGTGRGYLASSYEAKNTNRQFLNDYEYEGVAKSPVDKPMSYADMYNAHLNANKEEIAQGREPTPSNVSLPAGEDFIRIKHRKLESDMINIREPAETAVYSTPPQKNSCGMTMIKNRVPDDAIRARINPDILNAYRANPYTQSLSSAV